MEEEHGKIKFFKILSILSFIFAIVLCGVYFILYDVYHNLFMLITGICTIVSTTVSYYYAKWSVKLETKEYEKRNIGKTYLGFSIANLIPIVNILLLLIQTIMWIAEYVEYLTKNNKIDYNF